MSSPPASDVLPMAPAAAVPLVVPEAARALGLLRTTAWRGAGTKLRCGALWWHIRKNGCPGSRARIQSMHISVMMSVA